MVRCLMSQDHYLNQCWLLISKVLWHSLKSDFTASAKANVMYIQFEKYTSWITAASLRGQSLQWRHNERGGASNHETSPLFAQLLVQAQIKTKQTSKLRVTCLCWGNSPMTSEFSTQKARNAENVFIWRRHHNNLTHGANDVWRTSEPATPCLSISKICFETAITKLSVMKLIGCWQVILRCNVKLNHSCHATISAGTGPNWWCLAEYGDEEVELSFEFQIYTSR